MSYSEFKNAITKYLRKHRAGATWQELRDGLSLPYERPCPEWTRQLEQEIHLQRRKGTGRALVWSLPARQPSQSSPRPSR